MVDVLKLKEISNFIIFISKRDTGSLFVEGKKKNAYLYKIVITSSFIISAQYFSLSL
jgi:hypothetical protein